MSSINLIFPGQGAQYLGMYDASNPHLKSAFEVASEMLGADLADIATRGPEDKLKETQWTQPIIVAHSFGLYNQLLEVLMAKEIKIGSVLGHSVGEYSALTAAGSLDFKDAIAAVHQRGKFMQDAVPLGVGAMYAFIKVALETIEEGCTAVSSDESQVMVANYNDPTQTVVSGHKEACEALVSWIKDNYDEKHMAIPLKVSAPFHSALMLPAENRMKSYLQEVSIATNKIPYLSNVDAKKNHELEGEKIRQNLVSQISGSVLWYQSINSYPADSVFVEVGPGKVLTGLNKKINKDLRTLYLDQENKIEKLGEFLNECSL